MRAAIYARVSTIDKQNYDRQVSDLTPIILSHGHKKEHIEVFGENVSGYKNNDERPEFQRLLNIIAKDPSYFSCIYVTEISRLGRNPKQARETVDHLINLNVPIYVKTINQKTINDDGSRNTIMSIILQVLMEFAHLEAEQTKERAKSGLMESARKGKAGGGLNLAYGYKKDDEKMLVVDDNEALVIKEIFNLYKQGNGSKVICGILNERDVPTRSNISHAGKTLNFAIPKKAESIKWSDKQILDILSNPLYKGQRQYKGNILNAPSIISEELFDECTMIRESKTHRNYETTYTYLLKDIITCGCCGRNYFAKYKPTPRGDKVYICSSRLKKGGNCGNAGINISFLESVIYYQILGSDGVLKFLEDTNSIKKELETDIRRLESQIKVDEKALQTKEAEKGRLLSVFVAGHISEEDFISNNNELQTQIINLNNKVSLELKSLSKKKILLSKQNDGTASKKMLMDALSNRTEMATIIKQIVKKVIINPIDKDYIMATMFIQVHGYQVKGNIPLILETKGMRLGNKVYKYFPLIEENNFDENGILLSSTEKSMSELSELLKKYNWWTIPEENILHVE